MFKQEVTMKPFFKWAGGKRRQASTIIGEMGDLAAVKNYVEPFLGGGAVFFKLTEYDLSNKLIVLNDLNPEIANAYHCVRTHPTELVDLFDSWGTDANTYKPDLDVENLTQAGLTLGARALLNDTTITISCRSYDKIIREVADHRAGPMVIYCDPPYMPVSSTSFTKYTAEGFGEADHRNLRNLLDEVFEPGDTFLVSNSPAALEIFDGWEKVPIQAPRNINSKGGGRNNVTEYLFKKSA